MSNRKLVFIDTDYRYGFHCSKCPTFTETVKRVVETLPFTAFQIYLSSGRSYAPPKCGIDDILCARELIENYQVDLYAHGCLIYNLCGAVKHKKDPRFQTALENTCKGLSIELDIVAGLGGRGVVVHPNSCQDVKKGLYTASKTIEYVLTKNTNLTKSLSKKFKIKPDEFKRSRTIILENSAQEGNKRGGTLEELASMINGVDKKYRNQIKVCIDTAHAFGAGLYDWGKPSETERFYSDFDRVIGLEYLDVFHLNDSRESEKKGSNAFFGSKKDRHENLGLGWIFSDDIGGITDEGSRLEGLKFFLLEARKRGIRIIGEPPSTSKDGGAGLGGYRDWGFVCNVLKDTNFPLES